MMLFSKPWLQEKGCWKAKITRNVRKQEEGEEKTNLRGLKE
jgi:hypothetical protein